MKIFIPYSKQRPIKPEVLSSIKGDIVQINCTFDKTIPKLQRIILSENRFKEFALKEIHDFYVYQQSDMIHLKKDNLEIMQKFLIANHDFGAVALSRFWPINEWSSIYHKEWKSPLRKECGNHICSGCIMFTRKGLEVVKFNLDNESTCFSIGKSLADENLKYGYVDRELRIKHYLRNK